MKLKVSKGLEEKRGKAKGLGLGRPRTKSEDSEAKIKRLEAENEMLETGYTVTLLCTITGITRSGYYKWIKRHAVPSKKQLTDTAFKKNILECQTKLRGIYGYRRIQVWLKATYNLHLNHKRIQRLMSELGIKAIIRKKEA